MIFFGLSDSALGSVSLSTPFSNAASALSASTFTGKGTAAALTAVVLALLFRLFLALGLALDRQRVADDGDVHVVRACAGQRGLNHQIVVGLVDINHHRLRTPKERGMLSVNIVHI